MSLTGKIGQNNALRGAGAIQKTIQAKTVSVSGANTSLSTLTDVDITARTDGSMLQWDSTAGTFKVKPLIEDTNSNLKIKGGSF